ncbi:MAG: hypothetical protein NTZ05_15495 [Chloroflexi bacterium]|nr:hypothetical protein [Chloroflexota bacterium]
MGAATKTLFENALAAQQNTSGQGALRQEAIPHSIPLSQYNDLLERDQEIEHLIDVVGIEGAVHRAIETILEVNPDPEFHLWARDWLAGNRRLSKLSEKYPRRQYWPARLGLEALEAQTTLSRADGAAHEVQYAAQGLLSGDLISARMAVKSALRHCDYFRQDR